jgi:hypothetical protein
MHDARPLHAADPRQVVAVREKGIDQRAAFRARRRVNDHSLGLVENKQVVIFINDVERDRLGRDARWRGRGRRFQRYQIAGLQP